MRKNRKPGTGTITFERGMYVARLPLSLGRTRLDPQPTYEEAERLLDATVSNLQDDGIAPVLGDTWSTVANQWFRALPRRDGLERSYGQAVKRVSLDKWSRMPIATVCRRDLVLWLDARHANWRDKRKPYYSKATTTLDLATVNQVFRHALDREIVRDDPTHKVNLPRGWSSDDAWTYLTKDELAETLACENVPQRDRAIVAFLVGTGLRKWEWLALRLADVASHGITIRFGSDKGPTKSKKIRVLPWLPITVRAWSIWSELLPTHARRNPRGLAFPGPMGGWFRSWFDVTWYEILSAVGIERRVRPHDLRHTCGASLVSGYYNDVDGKPKRWPLVEVRDFLGHSSIKQTERYAHLAEGHLERSAAESLDTVGYGLGCVDHTLSEFASGKEDPDIGNRIARSIQGSPLLFVAIDDPEKLWSTPVGRNLDPTDLELQAAWTPWGHVPKLEGDPPDMTEQLRAAEGWA